MIDVRSKRLVVDGSPRILLSGEVHYFRLARHDWADRLDKLVAAGADTVASYIPWLCHEDKDGGIDVTGRTRPELDLGAFVDLARERGLYFLARPGPFVMAELKNEGLPYRLYDEHPEIHPVSWDGEPVPTRTVDYLAPAYLAEVERWYAAVMPVLANRLVSRGGNVVAVQLDNEIGMLSWVTGRPDLTDHLLADLDGWLRERYDADALAARYPGLALEDPAARAAGIRSPREEYAAALLHDLGRYMRARFARYVAALRGFAEAAGVSGVPFLVNIHGTADGRGTPFPIGISQLMDTYRGVPGMLSGSDHYFGDLTTRNAADLYLMNAFMDAVHDADQPLTSVEFEAGDGDYARDQATRYDPSAVDLKTRLCVAQGNRLLNYYLFAGGINPRLDTPVGDGNDRIAFTGERHGTGAPVGALGELGLTYSRTAAVMHAVRAVGGKLATMDEEHDDLAMGFVPDYFMTETAYPKSTLVREIVGNLERHRFGGPGQLMARAALAAGYRFGAVDLQDREALAPRTTPVLMLASARYLAAPVQSRLVSYLRAGGRLLLCGEVPAYDLEGRPCTTLQDALGVRPLGVRHGDHGFFLSVCASGWAAPRPEVRVSSTQLLEPGTGTVLLREYASGDACGLDVRVGAGRAVVLTTDYPGNDVAFYRTALETLGVRARLRHDAPRAGLLVTSTRNERGERFVHALNLDGYDADFRLTEDDRTLFGGHPVALPARSGVMLPIDLDLDPGVGSDLEPRVGHSPVRLAWATAEIAALSPGRVAFRSGPGECVAAFETDRLLHGDWSDATFTRDGVAGDGRDGLWLVRIPASTGGSGQVHTVAWDPVSGD
ncbi:beta-galactosidase [Actinopolymorpha pittospori]|uniref:Beta-galactosidase n=1 Tax=Actinopolymorpha pittospori TaxID=648752 RepID=A0A927MZ16_9ACTN|nr:beta-galactosidase [Actinopolymorpha pittospori]